MLDFRQGDAMTAALEQVDDWYYTAEDGEQVGPLATPALRVAYRDGRIQANTLIWREGMPSWRELYRLAPELGIVIRIDTEHLVAPAVRERFVLPRWLGLAGVLLLLMVVLAWLPAQMSPELSRPSQMEVDRHLAESRGLQIAVDQFFQERGRCPRNGEAGSKQPADYADGRLRAIRLRRQLGAAEVCVIDLIFEGARVSVQRYGLGDWRQIEASPSLP